LLVRYGLDDKDCVLLSQNDFKKALTLVDYFSEISDDACVCELSIMVQLGFKFEIQALQNSEASLNDSLTDYVAREILKNQHRSE